ncbi:MAG: ABC transporter ATP-binding protein [Chlorobium sp.]
MAVAVRLSAVSKKFGGFTANSNISLSIEKGRIHAIVGENGAGKSTLTKIIYGMHLPTSGVLFIEDKARRFTSPREAIRAGIGMVHQHFMLVPELSVTENIILGHERSHLFAPLPLKKAKATIKQDAESYGLAVDPDALVTTLSVGEQQRVEILKLLFRQVSIMIFDEPTAVLTPSESEQLFETLRSLRNQGKTIILITHKLDEVLSVADTISVMRKGEIVGTVAASSVTKQELAWMMVGRTILMSVANPEATPGKTVLSLKNLGYQTRQGEIKLQHLTLQVRAGEIYGIAGVEGNGQNELLQILWGLTAKEAIICGEATLNGTSIIGKKTAQRVLTGISLVPENRLRHAVITDYTVSENLLFGRHRERSFHHWFGFSSAVISNYAETMIADFDIRCGAPATQQLSTLSGGNQQKVVLAREFNRPAISLLILAQPTRGVDIGAIEAIHKKIIAARQRGLAILLLSSELDEIVALSTRIGCIFKGSIVHEFCQQEVSLKKESEHEFLKEIGLHIT